MPSHAGLGLVFHSGEICLADDVHRLVDSVHMSFFGCYQVTVLFIFRAYSFAGSIASLNALAQMRSSSLICLPFLSRACSAWMQKSNASFHAARYARAHACAGDSVVNGLPIVF